MSKKLEVDTDGLESDGRELAALGTVPKEEQCRPPASDPVSTTMAVAMSAYDQGLVQRLREAKEVREHGGAIVTASGVMFEVADEEGALMIDRVDVLGDPRPASAGPPTIVQPRQPDTRSTPRVPGISPQGLDAEQFSEAIHSGQGSRVVTDFGDHCEETSRDLEHLADRTQHISDSIQEHWRDADSNAAPNVRNHGTWLRDASEWATGLAKSADTIASAFDTVKADTPTPGQLAAAKHALQASAVLGPAAALVAFMTYENLKSKAIEAGAHYQTSVENAIKEVGEPIAPPSLIAKRAAIPPELVKGPGTWVSASRTDGDWRNYEQQATGFPAGMEYEVPRNSGPPVDFDGFDPDAGPNGLLVEAKGTGYDWMVDSNGEFKPDIKGAKQISDELDRQFQASQDSGVPVQWRVAEPRVAEAIQAMIDDRGYGGRVDVVVIPPA